MKKKTIELTRNKNNREWLCWHILFTGTTRDVLKFKFYQVLVRSFQEESIVLFPTHSCVHAKPANLHISRKNSFDYIPVMNFVMLMF